jgi:predicted O-methyltransferase YrrM
VTRGEICKRWGSPAWLLTQARDVLLDARDAMSNTEFAGLYRTVRPYSLAGNARLRALYQAVRDAVARGITGDVVECGTARGGSAALMALTLRKLGARRLLWVFDTFEGLPAPTHRDPDFDIARLYTGTCLGTLDEVRGLFERLDILSDSRLIKGLFQDTLPTAEVGPIAVLHLDGDWYDSVRVCLEHLYDRVSPGGVIQIDDYGHWEGARRAVDEFLRDRHLQAPLRWLDYTGRQMIKG